MRMTATLFSCSHELCFLSYQISVLSFQLTQKEKIDEVTTALSWGNRTKMDQCIHSMGQMGSDVEMSQTSILSVNDAKT